MLRVALVVASVLGGVAALRFGVSARSPPRPQNAPGSIYVDESCINCDVCRQLAPATFGFADGKSYVHTQCPTDAARRHALRAAVACPTGSIRTRERDPLMREVSRNAFPEPVAGLPQVGLLGWTSAKSFGAMAYVVGSVLVDSPRYNSVLADAIEQASGQPEWMLLTHVDDVADHARWKARFPGMQRVLHAADVRSPDTWPYIECRDVEVKLEGTAAFELAPGLTAIPSPGHSRGSACYLVGGERTGGDGALFSGDHLAVSARLGRLDGFGNYGDDVVAQAKSISALAELPFRWIFPGHGRRAHFESDAERRAAVLESAATFAADPYGRAGGVPMYRTPEA